MRYDVQEGNRVGRSSKTIAVPQSKKAGRPKAADFEFKPEDSVGYMLRDTYRAFARELGSRLAQEKVTMGMWFFLRALWEEEGLTQRELSRRIGMMEPTTVSALAAMERRGLVTRDNDPNDRRRRIVRLTRKGRGLKAKLLPAAYETNLLALEGVSDAEIKQLKKALSKMKQNLIAHWPD